MKFGLPEKTLQLIQAFFSANPKVLRVIIFGSRAMGQERPGSDIDLAIFTEEDKELASSIKSGLDELPTPYLFDVVDYAHIKHLPLREHIDRVGVVLFKR